MVNLELRSDMGGRIVIGERVSAHCRTVLGSVCSTCSSETGGFLGGLFRFNLWIETLLIPK